MQPISEPELLDAGRALDDEREDFTREQHRDRARLFAGALKDSCEYARQLWHELDAVRGYLVRSLPEPAGRPGSVGRATTPAGPDDEAGWQDWMDTYARVTSVLAGSHGDAGFGAAEARRLARERREVVVPVEGHPDAIAAPTPRKHRPADGVFSALTRPVPMVVLLALAARGLRRRRGPVPLSAR
jgi:hypothetical protein